MEINHFAMALTGKLILMYGLHKKTKKKPKINDRPLFLRTDFSSSHRYHGTVSTGAFSYSTNVWVKYYLTNYF